MTKALNRTRLAGLTAEEAAALWVVHIDAGHPVEVGLLDAWLSESVDNQHAWIAAKVGWDAFDPASLSDEPALQSLHARALEDSSRRLHFGSSYVWQPLAAAAAVIAVIFGVLNLETLRPSASHGGGFQANYASISSAPRPIRLPDGSSILLAGRTDVAVSFARDIRSVHLLHGRARFDVAHDRQRKFEVVVEGLTVTALGTRFEVARSTDRTLNVSLFEGRVGVSGRGIDVLLSPGQQFVAPATGPTRLTSAAAPSVPASSEEFIQLDDVTLADAAERLNRGSPVRLVIKDARVAHLHVSGRFKAHDAARFADTVSAFLPVRSVRTAGNTIEIRSAR